MASEGPKGIQDGSWKLKDASGRDQHGSKWSKDGQQVAPGGAISDASSSPGDPKMALKGAKRSPRCIHKGPKWRPKTS